MPTKKLTDSFIRGIEVPDGKDRIEYYDTVVTGMALRVTNKGSKSFFYKYRYGGNSKRYTIGSYPKFTLVEARRIAKELAYQVSQGIDLNYEKKKKISEEQKRITFNVLAEEFKRGHLPNLSETTAKEYKRILEKELEPKIGIFFLEDISKRKIISLLDFIAIDRGKKTLSNRVEAILSSTLSFAVGRAFLEINPVLHIHRNVKEKSRDRFYSDNEIKKLWDYFDKQKEPIASLFKFLLITGQRRGETQNAKWKDIDIENKIWTKVSDDTKSSKLHTVPLSNLACDIILGLKEEGSEYVFKSPKKNAPVKWIHKATERIKKGTGINDFRPHDLRRTVMTKMAELGIPQIVIGKLLNHSGLAGDNTVTAIYNRYDYYEEKKKAVEKWADILSALINDDENNI